jgi:integrase
LRAIDSYEGQIATHAALRATQVIALLRELQPVTGSGRYCFPALGSGIRPLSDNTLNAALRRLGYSGDEHTAHGFRSMASTLLNEQGWHPDLIGLQTGNKKDA